MGTRGVRWVVPFEEQPPQNGACTGYPTEWWFPERHAKGVRYRDLVVAKEICAGCHVRVESLEYAISSVEPYGIWGGLNIEARDAIARQRKANGTLKLFTKVAVHEPNF